MIARAAKHIFKTHLQSGEFILQNKNDTLTLAKCKNSFYVGDCMWISVCCRFGIQQKDPLAEICLMTNITDWGGVVGKQELL